MRRVLLICSAAAVAVVPAVVGLAGNPSFSQTVPVHLPPQVKVASAGVVDDHGGAARHNEPNDDRRLSAVRPTGSPTPSSATSLGSGPGPAAVYPHSSMGELEPGDNRGMNGPGFDDHAQALQPGDDRGPGLEPGDDRGRGLEPGDDHGGHGSDDGTGHR